MNLLFRLIWISLFSHFRSKVSILGPCRTPFRCWPTDLDILRHMNNGKYFSIMDLARVDLMIRARVAKSISQKGWYPVVSAETIQFRKSIGPFMAFEIETSVVGWDEKAIFLQQRFMQGETCFAEALVKARFLKKTGGSVMTQELLQLVGITSESPALPAWIQTWNQNYSR